MRFGRKCQRGGREEIQGGGNINGFFFFNGVRIEMQRNIYQENGFFYALIAPRAILHIHLASRLMRERDRRIKCIG